MRLAADTTSTIIPCLRFRNAHSAIERLRRALGLEKNAVHYDHWKA